MTISRIVGGLRNQMFQYVAGLRLASARKIRTHLDLSELENPTAQPARFYEAGALAVTAKIKIDDEAEALTKQSGNRI